MNVRFRRDVKHSYMLLSDAGSSDFDADAGTYMTGTLLNNRIEGLLPMTVERIDDVPFYQYDITSLMSLDDFYTSHPVTLKDMKSLLWSVLDTADRLEDYLLDTCHIYLAPDTLFLSQDNNDLFLPLVPSYEKDLKESMVDLVRFFLGKIRRDDKDAIVFGYQVIHELEEMHTTPADLKKYLMEEHEAADRNAADGTAANEGISGEELAQDFQKSMEMDPDLMEESRETGKSRNLKKAGGFIPERMSIITALFCLPAAGLIYLVMHISAIGYYTNEEAGIAGILAAVIIFAIVSLIRHKRTNKRERNYEELSYGATEHFMETSPEAGGTNRVGESAPVTAYAMPDELDQMQNHVPQDFYYNDDRTISLRDIQPNLQCTRLTPLAEGMLPVITVRDDEVHIGKMQADVDTFVTIQNPAISRIHARLFIKSGELWLCDLGSTNGTRVNGEPLKPFEPVRLTQGAKVEFADAVYEVK